MTRPAGRGVDGGGDVDGQRRAPVQGNPGPRGSIAWWEHVVAWEDYAKRYGNAQSAERIAERGGFGHGELRIHLGHAPTTFIPLAAVGVPADQERNEQ